MITGSGAMFSAGVDLLRVVDGGADYVRGFLPAMNRMFESAVRVSEAGRGGGERSRHRRRLHHRLRRRLAADGARAGRIGIPELLVGVPFPVVPLEIMRFATHASQLQSLAYRG